MGGWVSGWLGGFKEWEEGMGGRVGGGMGGWVGFINVNDMYNNDGGQGGPRVCEAHEVK